MTWRPAGAAEVGVEGDDAVDFGAGQVQGLGDGLHRLGRNTAQLVLDRVQHRQQRAGLVLEAGDDAGRGGHGWRLRSPCGVQRLLAAAAPPVDARSDFASRVRMAVSS